MATMMDIVGSAIIAGLLMLAVMRMNVNLLNTGSDTNTNVITQSDMTAIANSIIYDMYKIGFRASPAILLADTSRIKFLADMEKDGNPDTIYYYINPVSAGSGLNPNMLVLYRHMWRSTTPPASFTTGASLGQTRFTLAYYDSAGDSLAITAGGDTSRSDLSKIKSIKIKVMVQSSNALMSNTSYAGSYWEQFISPKNLRTLL